MPKVSIIVPNYNYKKYLPKRLESIVRQTFNDYEIILLDDHSTDGSQELLIDFANKNQQVRHCIINPTNTGNPFVQWQKGIELAEGEYVWIAESDDYCDPNFLAELLPLMDANPSAAFALCGSHLIDGNDKPIHKNFDTWSQEDGKAYLYTSQEYLKHYLLWRCTSYNASMVLFRKSFYQQITFDFSALRYSGDWLFWIKMAEKGDVIVLHKRHNYFRRHSTSVTAQVNGGAKQLREHLIIYAYLLERHNFGNYRNSLARGCLFKDIKRSNLDEATRNDFEEKLKEMGVSHSDYYFERTMKTLHSFLPFIAIPRKDNVKGKRIK